MDESENIVKMNGNEGMLEGQGEYEDSFMRNLGKIENGSMKGQDSQF